jgi:hypothetical protein
MRIECSGRLEWTVSVMSIEDTILGEILYAECRILDEKGWYRFNKKVIEFYAER